MTNTNMWYDEVVRVATSDLGVCVEFKSGSKHNSANPLMTTLTIGSYVGIDTHGLIWVKKEV